MWMRWSEPTWDPALGGCRVLDALHTDEVVMAPSLPDPSSLPPSSVLRPPTSHIPPVATHRMQDQAEPAATASHFARVDPPPHDLRRYDAQFVIDFPPRPRQVFHREYEGIPILFNVWCRILNLPRGRDNEYQVAIFLNTVPVGTWPLVASGKPLRDTDSNVPFKMSIPILKDGCYDLRLLLLGPEGHTMAIVETSFKIRAREKEASLRRPVARPSHTTQDHPARHTHSRSRPCRRSLSSGSSRSSSTGEPDHSNDRSVFMENEHSTERILMAGRGDGGRGRGAGEGPPSSSSSALPGAPSFPPLLSFLSSLADLSHPPAWLC